VVPSASAARRRMRFDKDLEPGNLTVPSIFFIGLSVSCSIAPVALHRVTARDERLGRRTAAFTGAKVALNVAAQDISI